jgi:hypothetical protein
MTTPRGDAGLDALVECLKVLKGKGWTPHSKIVRETATEIYRVWQADPELPVSVLEGALRQLAGMYVGFILHIKTAEARANDGLN